MPAPPKMICWILWPVQAQKLLRHHGDSMSCPQNKFYQIIAENQREKCRMPIISASTRFLNKLLFLTAGQTAVPPHRIAGKEVSFMRRYPPPYGWNRPPCRHCPPPRPQQPFCPFCQDYPPEWRRPIHPPGPLHPHGRNW